MNHLSILRNGVLICAAIIAIIASTYRLSEAPGIWYDEGFYTQIAMNVADGHGQVLQTAPTTYAPTTYISVGFPLIMPLSISYKLFGVGVLQGRAVMVLFILGFVAASYALTRHLAGSWAATATTLLLATFPMLYGNGKSVLGEVPGFFFLTLTLLALYYLERTKYKDWRGYVAVGIAAGLCVATKPIFILFLGALALTLLIRWKKITLNWYGVLGGAGALFGILTIWALLQFGADASLSKILADYANPYGSTNTLTLISHNLVRFVTESTPLYTLILMFTWSASLFLRRKVQEISVAEIAAFTFCLLTIASYLRLEGWYRYLFPATTIAMLFFPQSLQVVFNFASTYVRPLSRFIFLPFALVVVLSLAQLYQTARTSFVAQYYNGTRTRDISAALIALDPNSSVFLYNTPELAILLPTKKYYQYLSPSPQVTIGEKELEVLTKGAADVVLVDSDTYTEYPETFKQYVVEKTVDRYDILQKKQL